MSWKLITNTLVVYTTGADMITVYTQTDLPVCCSPSGVDYLAPREMIGQGIVDFVPNSHLGKLSTPLLIQLHKDGIVETTEYFGIDFTIESDDMRTLNIAKRGRSARVAIVDRDGMYMLYMYA